MDGEKTNFGLEFKITPGKGLSVNFREPEGGLPPIIFMCLAADFLERYKEGKLPEQMKPIHLLQLIANLGIELRHRNATEDWKHLMSSYVVIAIAEFLHTGINDGIPAATGWKFNKEVLREHLEHLKGAPDWVAEFDGALLDRLMTGGDPEQAQRDLLAEWLEHGRAPKELNKLAAYVVRHGSWPEKGNLQKGNYIDPPSQKKGRRPDASFVRDTLLRTAVILLVGAGWPRTRSPDTDVESACRLVAAAAQAVPGMALSERQIERVTR